MNLRFSSVAITMILLGVSQSFGANPYCVSGADNRPGRVLDRLDMPEESLGYIWDTLMPENPVQMVRPCRYWDYIGFSQACGNGKFWGYHEDTDTIEDPDRFATWVLDHPGKIWLIGNEPNLHPIQDGLTPEEYARMYNTYYSFISERDPTARFGVAALAMDAVPGNVNHITTWWETALSAYKNHTGSATMPVDIWNFHLYAPPWVRDPQIVMDLSVTPFTNWVRTVDGGIYQDAELWCTEFGVGAWMGPIAPERAAEYMHNICLKWERESEIDRWFWFVGPWASWDTYCDWCYTSLLDADQQKTILGEVYSALAQGYPNTTLDYIPELVPGVPPALFYDDFETGFRDEWYVKAGKWVADASAYRQTDISLWGPLSTTLPYLYDHQRVSVDIRIEAPLAPENWAGISLRKENLFYCSTKNGYLVYLRANGEVGLFRGETLASNHSIISSATDTFHRLEVSVVGPRFIVTLNGVPAIDFVDEDMPYETGWTALEVLRTEASFDNFEIEVIYLPTHTPTITPTPIATNTPRPGCWYTECFETLPVWSSHYDSSGTASWIAAAGGHDNMCLQVSRSSAGSTSRVLVYHVTPGIAYDLSVFMRTAAIYNHCFWMETAFKSGDSSALEFDQSPEEWTLINKFDGDCGQHPNGQTTWTEYRVESVVFEHDRMSLGFKLGATTSATTVGRWDSLNILPAGYTPPTFTPMPPTNTPTPIPPTLTPIPPTDTPVPETPTATPIPLCMGDANKDMFVNADDYRAVRDHFGTQTCGVGDANGDCFVNADDYRAVRDHFGQSCL